MAQRMNDDSKNQLLDSYDEYYCEDDPTQNFQNLKSDLLNLSEQVDSLKLLVKKQQKLAFENDEKKTEKLIQKTIHICEKSIEDIQVSIKNLTLIFDVKNSKKVEKLITNIQKYIATQLADKIVYLGNIEQKLTQIKEEMYSDLYQNSNFNFINEDEIKDHQKMIYDNKGNQMIMQEIKEYEMTDDLKKMYGGITKLSRFLKDIQALTERQGVVLDRIDMNIEQAIQKTKKTNIELEICQQELKKGFVESIKEEDSFIEESINYDQTDKVSNRKMSQKFDEINKTNLFQEIFQTEQISIEQQTQIQLLTCENRDLKNELQSYKTKLLSYQQQIFEIQKEKNLKKIKDCQKCAFKQQTTLSDEEIQQIQSENSNLRQKINRMQISFNEQLQILQKDHEENFDLLEQSQLQQLEEIKQIYSEEKQQIFQEHQKKSQEIINGLNTKLLKLQNIIDSQNTQKSNTQKKSEKKKSTLDISDFDEIQTQHENQIKAQYQRIKILQSKNDQMNTKIKLLQIQNQNQEEDIQNQDNIIIQLKEELQNVLESQLQRISENCQVQTQRFMNYNENQQTNQTQDLRVQIELKMELNKQKIMYNKLQQDYDIMNQENQDIKNFMDINQQKYKKLQQKHEKIQIQINEQDIRLQEQYQENQILQEKIKNYENLFKIEKNEKKELQIRSKKQLELIRSYVEEKQIFPKQKIMKENSLFNIGIKTSGTSTKENSFIEKQLIYNNSNGKQFQQSKIQRKCCFIFQKVYTARYKYVINI